MIILVTLFWAVVCCGLFLSLLPYRFYRMEFAATTLFLAFLLGTWLIFALSCCMPYRGSEPLAAVLLAVGSRFLYARRQRGHCTWMDPQDEPWRYWPWRLVTVASTVGLGILFVTHMAQVRADGTMYSGAATWSDMGMHLSLMSYQSQQPQFEFVFPLVYNGHLVYHFLIDWLSSLFLRDHFSIANSLLIPGLTLALVFVQMVFFLSYRIFRHGPTAALTVFLFMLGGSTAATWVFATDAWTSPDGVWAFLHRLATTNDPMQWPEYTTYWEHNIVFSNFITCALLPQRPVLLGFPAVTFLLALAYLNEEHEGWMGPLLGGLVIGLMPLAHVHAWMVGSCVLAALAGRELLRQRRPAAWVGALLLSVLVAAPQLAYLRHAAYHQGYGFFQIGWLADRDQSLPLFWWRNMGPALILMLLAWDACLHRYRHTQPLPTLYAPFLALFVLGNIYIFQPSAYDNIKIFHLVFLAVCWLGAPLLMDWWQKRRWRQLVVVVAVLLWVVPGCLSLWREVKMSDWSLATADEQLFGRLIREKTEADALFLIPPDQHEPVSMLGGRRVVLGWQGWLESYGLTLGRLATDVKTVLNGEPGALDVLVRYNVDYVVFDKVRGDEWSCKTDFYRAKIDVPLQVGSSRFKLHSAYEDQRWWVVKVEREDTPAPK